MPWEQGVLPSKLKKNQTILSLCNISPVLAKKSVVMIHDAQFFMTPESFSFKFRIWNQICIFLSGRFSNKVLTVSEFSKQQLIKYRIANAEKITVIHNGCDHIHHITSDKKILDKLNLNNKKYVVAQANYYPYKNISLLLKAFCDDDLKDVTLVLYGSGSKKDFDNLNLIIPENVIFTGRVSDEELKAIFENAIATLTPSLTEGFGLQPLESMVVGTPAIVAPCGALPEVCGDAALYADPYKPEIWIALIRKLIDEEGFSESLNEKMLKHWQKFTWNVAATKLLNILDDV